MNAAGGPGARLRFWGVRGSVPAPGPSTAATGGNTPCVSVEAPGAPLIVLDAGTGIRSLGSRLASAPPGTPIELLLTHTHWDHIHGLPFFAPLYAAGADLRITGPRHQASLRTVLERLTAPECFPIPAARWAGLTQVRELEADPLALGPAAVRPITLNHPGPTLGYRIDVAGAGSVAYLTDNELSGHRHGVPAGWRQALIDLVGGCDVMVHDTTWADDEVARHAGWGHSSPMEAIRLAREAGCRRVVLFHHHPDHDDGRLADSERRAADAGEAAGLGVVLAREGMDVSLGGMP